MSAVVDVFFSFRSPYSYLVTPDLLKLRDDYHVEVKLRPVLPIALRAKEAVFDDPQGQKKVSYILTDAFRRADYLGMKITWPSPDPIVQDLSTFEVAEEQPYIYRLSALGVAAERLGKGIDLAYVISHLIFGGTEGWDKGDHMKKALASVDIDLDTLEANLDLEECLKEVEHNQTLLDESGHWGVPTMAFNGEPFFGQDRIDTLRWRLDQHGLNKNP
ncbi:DsbA family protein [Pseudoteredinibacter isoporae]|uniref:2-hydroxychromene-2-carboxylate isomerase n=1 Tax=Pseudoteredinibacter isoporae TaxID=570281 RepID=A0A7X0MZ61_9GAMM|nr:2-hydroxychromene-2-carboxylate isomerase [Pseudoteredinibacter isoporae]NHO89339.1 2-hydroxychromene-2-carboxylate isomerase [Pseudoteredinibacter isoporae]NIB22446.1 2-hydroxychromene-2-carboxylate isomerase [Pseudoteredinibacter isoporae]